MVGEGGVEDSETGDHGGVDRGVGAGVLGDGGDEVAERVDGDSAVDGLKADLVPQGVGGGVVADGGGEVGEVAQGQTGVVEHGGEAGSTGGAADGGDVDTDFGSCRVL